jgi:hypothetical protein
MKETRLKSQISAATDKEKKKSKAVFSNEELISEDFFLTANPGLLSGQHDIKNGEAEESAQFDHEAIIHKNLHLMQFYREYTVEKRRIHTLNHYQK